MKNRDFEIIPQDGTVKMRVWGKTLEGLFQNSVKGIASYLVEGAGESALAGAEQKHAIRIEAVDIHSLLVDCLSEIVAQSDIYNCVFPSIAFGKFGENFLEGEISGIPVEHFDNEIKAVSYQEVDVKKNPSTGYFETTLVLEV
ncbi:MAG: hypothetical protein UY61_C0046G0003 [Candidatus Adlerbacteria bacterium GW2011_GWC1_50_9]|uniref:Archease domain-containing protein n=1 Tax=Candidatus Adlerbacteria bacterium GW2011_GWC1_50_9 TaxID=1618608 RepID=A0A0G1YYI0_9BACT|nr:MAG: hypothetical protein UY61_C0046G0003 [Candidatus Adlerbacteria bacterium GW2011_GWC1_50_9]